MADIIPNTLDERKVPFVETGWDSVEKRYIAATSKRNGMTQYNNLPRKAVIFVILITHPKNMYSIPKK